MIRRHQAQLEMRAGDEELGAGQGRGRGEDESSWNRSRRNQVKHIRAGMRITLCDTRSSLNPGSLLCQVEASLSHQRSGSGLGWPRWLFKFLPTVSVRGLKHPTPQAPASYTQRCVGPGVCPHRAWVVYRSPGPEQVRLNAD